MEGELMRRLCQSMSCVTSSECDATKLAVDVRLLARTTLIDVTYVRILFVLPKSRGCILTLSYYQYVKDRCLLSPEISVVCEHEFRRNASRRSSFSTIEHRRHSKVFVVDASITAS